MKAKRSGGGILLTLVLGAAWGQGWAQAPVDVRPPPARAVFEQSREGYVNVAVLQVQIYRRQLEAARKAAPAERERHAEASRLLKQMELLIARLRSAAPGEFEAVRTEYERTQAAYAQRMGARP